jgi:diguanylate cyclase (GGDEF)-like protein
MDQLAIIGVSGSGGSVMSARFLKKGANDFIVKPFSNEEFYLRINQNVEMLEYIDAIRKAAIKDHLTGLYNRRYFFEVGEKLFKNAQRKNFDIVLAMIDIDHFKRVNDQYGHAVGDKVLRHISGIMTDRFRSSDVIARLGGEEFCVMAPGMSPDHCFEIFDTLRQSIASDPLTVDGNRIDTTISIGLTATLGATLEATLDHADRLLYQAKNQGRNRVVPG